MDNIKYPGQIEKTPINANEAPRYFDEISQEDLWLLEHPQAARFAFGGAPEEILLQILKMDALRFFASLKGEVPHKWRTYTSDGVTPSQFGPEMRLRYATREYFENSMSCIEMFVIED